MKSYIDTNKTISDSLANLLMSQDSLPGLRQLMYSELNNLGNASINESPQRVEPKQTEANEDNTLKPITLSSIGIWGPKISDGRTTFVRTPNRSLWWTWANVESIKPKNDGYRVVLFGESVARSFPIDPHFNCANALQIMLQSATGRNDIEVVDLARSGHILNELVELLAPSLALDPDIYVIFAGNNWLSEIRTTFDFSKLSALLRDNEKWELAIDYIEDMTRKFVYDFLIHLEQFSGEKGIPVIFIIPEFNLLDWQTEDSWRNPLMSDSMVKQSIANKDQAEIALADRNLHLAAALAQEIIELEEGTNPIAFDILAKCRLYQGRIDEARRLKEKAIDNVFNLAFSVTNRCSSVAQEVLRQESEKHGILLVDLPKRFAEYLPETLPGRQFFYDHCHMTVDGIRLAMASTAEKILSLLGKYPNFTWADLNQLDIHVDSLGLALSHVAAAHISACWGQSYEIISYHCRKAIECAPEITELMWILLNVHLQRTNIKYIRDIENLLGEKGQSSYKFIHKPIANLIGHYGPAKILTQEGLYPVFVQVLVDILSDSIPDIQKIVDTLWKQNYAVDLNEIDLLKKPYIDQHYAQPEGIWQEISSNYKCYRSESSFRIICSFPSSICINLTCRVPNAKTVSEPIKLFVNGKILHSFSADTRWQTIQFEIPANFLEEGINSIIIRWPEPHLSRKERVEKVAETLVEAIIWANFMDIFTVYGEIHDFRAKKND